MIDVLLASYRPNAQWLAAQVDSIRAQRDVEVNLIVREDGKGAGPCANFSALIAQSHSDYAAFSDQDDVWLPDKLSKGMAKMRELERQFGKNVPLLVFSDEKVVDANLMPVAESLFHRIDVNPLRNCPRQLVLQNTAYGNTMLFNAVLRDLAKPIPAEAVMHDHWLMLVASAFGHIGYIDEQLVLYRQHAANVNGAAKARGGYYFNLVCKRRASLRKRQYENIIQAEAFAVRFGKCAPAEIRALVGFFDKPWLFRVITLIRNGIFKKGFARNLGMWLVA